MKVNKRVLRAILLVGCSACGLISGFSQNYVDLLRLEYSNSPGNAFKSGAGASDIQEVIADATIPIVLSTKNSLLTGFLYEHVYATLYSGQEPVTVNTVNLKLGLNQTYSDRWSATYFLLPKLASDLKRVRGDDVQIGLAALFKLVKTPQLNFRFGGYYNTDQFGPFFTPLFGLYYQKKKWEVNILLPTTVDLNYHIADALRLGLRFNGSIRSFHLNSNFQGTEQYLSKSNNEIGAYIGWAVGRVNLMGMLGHSVGRNYRTYAAADQVNLSLSLIKLGDDRTPLNTDIKDGLVFKVLALYRLELAGK